MFLLLSVSLPYSNPNLNLTGTFLCMESKVLTLKEPENSTWLNEELETLGEVMTYFTGCRSGKLYQSVIKHFTGHLLYLGSLAIYLSLRAIIEEIMKFGVCLHFFISRDV